MADPKNAPSADARTPRSVEGRQSDDRSTEKRELSFDPAAHQEMLPTPEPRDGIEYRYVRVTVRGEVDGRNFTNAQRAGWEPVGPKDVPELAYVISDMNHPLQERIKDAIVIGGLVLCQRDAEIGRRMQEVANEEVQRQITAVDQNYMREGDSRMPKFADNRSSVRFGD